MEQDRQDRDREPVEEWGDPVVEAGVAWAAIGPAPESAENVCVLRVARPFLIK